MIATARFLLRPLTVDDATQRYAAWFKDDMASTYITAAGFANAVPELRRYIAARTGRPDVLFLGIFTKASGVHIGNIKYEPISIAGRFAVMGILIGDKGWRGKGVAEEVILASASDLRDRIGIRTVYLGVHKSHISARKSYEKSGFRITFKAPFAFDPSKADAMALELPAAPRRQPH